ncbi:MAG: M20/M25/M40 family metallo-hydrolase [Immundisolibacterales bacterium]|nr:M20/M25/M40 family metallo-hydrolase [Immundisolibacterales bacterium]
MSNPRRNRPAYDADEILEGIRTWVFVESPTNVPDGVNRVMDLAEREMVSAGAAIERESGGEGYGDLLTARIPGESEGPGILVLGHLDTVHAVGTLERELPFRREGDRVYGPGIYDMKGGMYSACYALKQLLRAGRTPNLPVTFMFIPNEEVGSPTTRSRIEAEAKRHHYVLVPEPAKEGKLVTGRHAIARFRVRVRGRPSHAGSTLARGRSAIREMAEQILAIEGMTDHEAGVTLSVGIVHGGTFVNVVPIECEAEVLAVLPAQEDIERITAAMVGLEPINPDVSVAVEVGPLRPVFAPHSKVMDLYSRAESIAGEIGFNPGHGSFGGGSDGNFTGALGLATLDGLGPCGDGAHTHDEYILYSSLVPRARLLAGLLASLDVPDEPA